MELKNKVLGTIAALGLSFSMLAGVAAAPASGTVGGQVELKEGVCGIVLEQTNSDFGVWEYRDGDYVRASGNNEMYVEGTVFASKPGGTCYLTASTNGLVGPGGTVIPTNLFSWNINGGGWRSVGTHQLPAEGTIPVPAMNATIGLRLNDVPNFQPGVYAGTLEVTIGNTAP